MEHRSGQVGSVVMGFLEGRLESLMEEEREGTTESSSSSEAGILDASGNGVAHENNLSDICTNHNNIQSPEPGREWKIREVR